MNTVATVLPPAPRTLPGRFESRNGLLINDAFKMAKDIDDLRRRLATICHGMDVDTLIQEYLETGKSSH